MKKLLLASAALALAAGGASAQNIKIGVLLGYTGPIESITPAMYDAAAMAMKEVTASKALLGGATVTPVKADDTCTDSATADAAATTLVTADHVAAIVGGDCSGVTGSVLQTVARPNGIVMVSPSATSPALTTAPSDGLFYRTAPSDARQGQVMTDVLMKRGYKSVAVTYVNNDYGKGLANAFITSFKKAGGSITADVPHPMSKGDYSAEVGTLASAGGQVLVVAGYVDKGGNNIIQGSVDAGSFSKFYLPDGMFGTSLIKMIGAPLNGSFGDHPGIVSAGHTAFLKLAKADGFDGTSSYTGESYDAAALIMLAMQAAKSAKSEDFKSFIPKVANGPGVKILPGQLAKGLKLLAEGKSIDYEGATGVHLIGRNAAGSYAVFTVKDGKFVTDRYIQ